VIRRRHVEDGESIAEAAHRELKEENRLDTEVVRVGDGSPSQIAPEYELVPVLMETDSQDVSMGREHTDHAWIELPDSESYETIGQEKRLQKLGLRQWWPALNGLVSRL